jgi:hypothetical protein
MPQAKGLNAYPNARALLDRALDSERGIKLPYPDYSQAFKMRMNCYTVRSRERKYSTEIYESSHPLHGQTPWDGIEMIIEDSVGHIVQSTDDKLDPPYYLVFRKAQLLDIEEL